MASPVAHPIEIDKATTADLTAIAAILGDVQRWMERRGIGIWGPPFTDEWIEQKIASGEFHLARVKHVPVATVRLLWTDAMVWGELDQGEAAYIHTLAVRRDYAGQGIGARVLSWAGQYAKAHRRRFLRLDCVADSLSLVAYYRRLGFTQMGTAHVGGADVALFEKDLGD